MHDHFWQHPRLATVYAHSVVEVVKTNFLMPLNALRLLRMNGFGERECVETEKIFGKLKHEGSGVILVSQFLILSSRDVNFVTCWMSVSKEGKYEWVMKKMLIILKDKCFCLKCSTAHRADLNLWRVYSNYDAGAYVIPILLISVSRNGIEIRQIKQSYCEWKTYIYKASWRSTKEIIRALNNESK